MIIKLVAGTQSRGLIRDTSLMQEVYSWN